MLYIVAVWTAGLQVKTVKLLYAFVDFATCAVAIFSDMTAEAIFSLLQATTRSKYSLSTRGHRPALNASVT